MVDTDKYRVVIVDDIAETRENIRKLLQFEPDVEVVGVARTGREAIDIAKDVKPDVLLNGYQYARYGWDRCDRNYSKDGSIHTNYHPIHTKRSKLYAPCNAGRCTRFPYQTSNHR